MASITDNQRLALNNTPLVDYLGFWRCESIPREQTAMVFTTRTVRSLERRGLLSFDPEAGRYSLTDKGREARS